MRRAALGAAVTLLLHKHVGLLAPAVCTMEKKLGALEATRALALPGAGALEFASTARRLLHLRRPENRSMRGGGDSSRLSVAVECGALTSPAEDDCRARPCTKGSSVLYDPDEIELIESPPDLKAEHFEVDGADDGRVYDFSNKPEQHSQARFHDVAGSATKLVEDGGVCIEQIRTGTGMRVPRDGDHVYIHYRAFVMGGDGRQFDNSRTSEQRNGKPYGFTMV